MTSIEDVAIVELELDRVCRLLLASERSLALVNRRALAATLANLPSAPGQVLPPAPPFAEAVAIAREDGQLVERTRLFLATHPRAIEELTPELTRVLVQIFDPTGRTARLIRSRPPIVVTALTAVGVMTALVLLVATTLLVERLVADVHPGRMHPPLHARNVLLAAQNLHLAPHLVSSAHKTAAYTHTTRATTQAAVPAAHASAKAPTSTAGRASVATQPDSLVAAHLHAAISPSHQTNVAHTPVSPVTTIEQPSAEHRNSVARLPQPHAAVAAPVAALGSTTLPAPAIQTPGNSGPATPSISRNATHEATSPGSTSAAVAPAVRAQTTPAIATSAPVATASSVPVATSALSTRDEEAQRYIAGLAAQAPDTHVQWVRANRINPDLLTVRASVRHADTTSVLNFTLHDDGLNFTLLNAQKSSTH